MNLCVLSISSNEKASENLKEVKLQLQSLFSDVYFTQIVKTTPYGSGYKSNFQNLLAEFTTSGDMQVVAAQLKQLECNMGRSPEMKTQKRVPIDLDIIIWNKSIVRDDYYKFAFIQELISELPSYLF